MKIAIASLIAILSLSPSAHGGVAQGKNRLGELIQIERNYDGAYGYKIAVIKDTEEFSCTVYDSTTECPDWDTTHACNKNSRLPLAGAQYKVVRNTNLENDTRNLVKYTCISGCNKMQVPLEIIEYPDACKVSEHRIRSDTSWQLNSDDVEVKDRPTACNKKLHVLKKGTKVDLITRRNECVNLQVGDGEGDFVEGQWVKVKYLHKGVLTTGWIFDPFID